MGRMRWGGLLALGMILAACTTPAGPPAPAPPAPAAAGQTTGEAACSQVKRMKVGVSVTPPNVVHTPPYVARDLGLFARRCLDIEIVEFEGGLSATNLTAVAQGQTIASIGAAPIAAGLRARQFWGMAPRLPQAYVVAPEIKTAADLKGKRLSAAGGGVGSFNWVMGREVLKTAGLTVDDVQFVSQGTAGRLPGLVTGQIDGVALHPEDVYLAQQQRPGVNILVQLSDLLPEYFFNAYGAAEELIQRDRDLVRNLGAALIEANRTIYRERERVLPIMVEATKKEPAAVAFAYDYLTRNCIWSVNTGLSRERTEWTIQNAIDNGDIKPEQRPTYEQVVDLALAEEALALAGGPVTLGNCAD
ncbi:MAG TPA: ABC transporter substrate-binding protein [Chloroflexota bacterium]|nr:ABC transporter substrate-binding protein [Chloroflexota bacterium]